jgi:hypothetical protein
MRGAYNLNTSVIVIQYNIKYNNTCELAESARMSKSGMSWLLHKTSSNSNTLFHSKISKGCTQYKFHNLNVADIVRRYVSSTYFCCANLVILIESIPSPAVLLGSSEFKEEMILLNFSESRGDTTVFGN